MNSLRFMLIGLIVAAFIPAGTRAAEYFSKEQQIVSVFREAQQVAIEALDNAFPAMDENDIADQIIAYINIGNRTLVDQMIGLLKFKYTQHSEARNIYEMYSSVVLSKNANRRSPVYKYALALLEKLYNELDSQKQ